MEITSNWALCKTKKTKGSSLEFWIFQVLFDFPDPFPQFPVLIDLGSCPSAGMGYGRLADIETGPYRVKLFAGKLLGQMNFEVSRKGWIILETGINCLKNRRYGNPGCQLSQWRKLPVRHQAWNESLLDEIDKPLTAQQRRADDLIQRAFVVLTNQWFDKFPVPDLWNRWLFAEISEYEIPVQSLRGCLFTDIKTVARSGIIPGGLNHFSPDRIEMNIDGTRYSMNNSGMQNSRLDPYIFL